MNGRSLPREFVLAAACCRWPPSVERNEAIRAATAEVTDWKRFLQIVNRQRVWGLVDDGLKQAAIDLPKAASDRLRRAALAVARNNLKLVGESVRLQEVFDGESVAALFLKGAVLSALAFGNPVIKHAWDIDILILPEAIEVTHALLLREGYDRVRPPAEFDETRMRAWMRLTKECVYWHGEKDIYLELHWRLADNRRLIPDITAASPSQKVQLGENGFVRTLADDALFSHLCVHGAGHAWFRLKWVCEIAAFLAGKNDVEIERLFRASQAQGAGRCAGQALLLCERLLGTILPGAMSAELRGDARTRWLEAIALDAMAGANAAAEIDDRSLGELPIRLSYFLFQDGWRYRWAEIQADAVAPNDLILFPLPQWLTLIYPLIRIPSWLLRLLSGFGRGPLMTNQPRTQSRGSNPGQYRN